MVDELVPLSVVDPPLPGAPPLPGPPSLPSTPPAPVTPPRPVLPPVPRTPPLPGPASFPAAPPEPVTPPEVAAPPVPGVPPIPVAPPLPEVPPAVVPPVVVVPPLPVVPPLAVVPPLPTVPPDVAFPPLPEVPPEPLPPAPEASPPPLEEQPAASISASAGARTEVNDDTLRATGDDVMSTPLNIRCETLLVHILLCDYPRRCPRKVCTSPLRTVNRHAGRAPAQDGAARNACGDCSVLIGLLILLAKTMRRAVAASARIGPCRFSPALVTARRINHIRLHSRTIPQVQDLAFQRWHPLAFPPS
jgi:hypothetical protein